MEQSFLGGSAKARLLYLRGLRPERDVRDTRSCQFESAHTVQHAVHIRAWNLAYACPYRDVLLHPSIYSDMSPHKKIEYVIFDVDGTVAPTVPPKFDLTIGCQSMPQV